MEGLKTAAQRGKSARAAKETTPADLCWVASS
jgi:hypothetical protein